MPLAPLAGELSSAQITRYARHILLPEIGMSGQRRLLGGSVLVVGAGGLGSAVLPYLAGAGVGHLTIIDDDVVDATNLQRQVVHTVADIGRPKAQSAAELVLALNPEISVQVVNERLTESTVLALVAEHDVVVDGADNFETRYLCGFACAQLGVPHVWGSVYRHDAQVSVWWPPEGPCYRCVFKDRPAPEDSPSCSVGGVLGASCGVIGSLMAQETIKLLTGVGEVVAGRIVIHDALAQSWGTIPVLRDPECATCGDAAASGYAVTPDPGTAVTGSPSGSAGLPSDDSGPDVAASAEQTPTDQGESPSSETADVLPSVSVEQLADTLRLRAAGEVEFTLLDVRDAGELELVRLPETVAIPLREIRRRGGAALAEGAGGIPDGPVLVHCKTGGRSAEAVRLLRAEGIDAVNVEGGIMAWVERIDPSLPTY